MASSSSSSTMMNNNKEQYSDINNNKLPESVEEAGALLGATITQCGKQIYTIQSLPDRMHSSFAIVQPIPNQELLTRLHNLRSLLRTEESKRTNTSSGDVQHFKQQQQQQQPLVAALSLLPLLKKFIGISVQLATVAQQQQQADMKSSSSSNISMIGSGATASTVPGGTLLSSSSRRYETPPLLSIPLRKLWVDCIVTCHRLGGDATRNEIITFIQQMLSLAVLNPRTQKASGGVRIAALDVITALLEDTSTDIDLQFYDDIINNNDGSWKQTIIKSRRNNNNRSTISITTVAQQLSPWTYDILNVALRALRSAGSGEPSYRVSAIRAACATTVACRKTYYEKILRLATDNDITPAPITMWFKSAIDDKAIYEAVKVLKQAVVDKFPEVRYVATTLAASIAPMSILSSNVLSMTNSAGVAGSGATAVEQLSCLDEIIILATKNLDDDSPAVADGWAEALARCISVAIQFNQQSRADSTSNTSSSASNGVDVGKGVDADGDISSPGRFSTTTSTTTTASRKATASIALQLTSLPKAILFLVDQYCKVGGEMSSLKMGGTYSIGGRASRLGYSLTLIKLLQIQRKEIGESRSVTVRQIIQGVLNMVNDDVDKTFKQPTAQDLASVTASTFFGSGGKVWSRADSSLVLLTCVRVLRQGLAELSSEPMQITILQELLHFLPSRTSSSTTTTMSDNDDHGTTRELNPSQLQVLLIEISHLFAALRDVAATRTEEAILKLQVCLCHANHGVRQEAAIALTSIGTIFPNDGLALINTFLTDLVQHHVSSLQEIVISAATTAKEKNKTKNNKKETTDTTAAAAASRGLGMFRRGPTASNTTSEEKQPKIEDLSRPHQYAIHGKTLFISIMIKALSTLPGGVQVETLANVLTVATKLESLQFDDQLASASASIIISCIRAGFCIISGVLTTGPDGANTHMDSILAMWKKACDATKIGSKFWSAKYDLHSLDSILTSIVVFLKYCSELLLTIPEALSKITLMLEDMFELVQPTGRLGSLSPSIQLMARLESAKASLFETFAWLPSGSFPILADNVFTMSVDHIRQAIEDNVATSILPSLVSTEDAILDTKTFARAKREGETACAKDIEESIITLTGEPTLHGERESVLLLRSDEPVNYLEVGDDHNNRFRESCILYSFASDINKTTKYPTPLHTVGTWRRPLDPSCSSKVRLVDAAIQAFASTFGLKDGQEQDQAMSVLESLVPSALSRMSTINPSSIEQDKRSKGADDSAAIINITTVLVCCLNALPIHESTHNIPIGLGPPWMNKAKDLFLTFLPVASSTVRRAVAEGLSLLATLGVTEDAHFLQSSVLHSLDGIMRLNKPDTKLKGTIPEFASSARAGSLLTLACIQRTAFKVKQKQLARARGRMTGNTTETLVDAAQNTLPVLQMMTRIVPSVSGYGFKDFFMVKTYALHSYSILLAYSNRSSTASLSDEDKQLLLKGVELVEDNFVSSWTATSIDFDHGQEAEKMATEVAFNAVLLRLMTFLVPFLRLFRERDPDIARRFSLMASMILECHGSYPTITIEGMAFFEVLCGHQDLLPKPVSYVKYSENPIFSCILNASSLLSPSRPGIVAQRQWQSSFKQPSGICLRATVFLLKALTKSGISVTAWSELKLVSALLATLESASCSRGYSNSNLLRCVTTSRVTEQTFYSATYLESEISKTILCLLARERYFFPGNRDRFVRWILFSRDLLAGGNTKGENEEVKYDRLGVVTTALSVASADTRQIYDVSNPICSSVKCIAAQIAAAALDELSRLSRAEPTSMDSLCHFNMSDALKECSTRCARAAERKSSMPNSMLVLHLEEVLASACMSCIATIDQADVLPLQECSIYFLSKLIECFGPYPDPENLQLSILDQYSTQIFSSIRHALSAADGSATISSSRLVLSGCKALFSCVEAKLVSDPATLRRLLRPIVPSDSDTPYFGLEEPFPAISSGKNVTSQERAAQTLILCAKLWTTGSLLIGNDSTIVVSDELIKNKSNLAVHLAAAAIDGTRILYGNGLSLDKMPLEANDARRDIPVECGFHYASLAGVDECLKDLLTSNWAAFASRGLRPLLNEFVSSSAEDDRRVSLSVWIKSIVNLLIAGTVDCLSSLSSDANVLKSNQDFNPISTLTEGLDGLTLVCSNPEGIFDHLLGLGLSSVVDLLHAKLFVPILCQEMTKGVQQESTCIHFDSKVVTKACNLLSTVADMDTKDYSAAPVTLLCILKQLKVFQQHPEVVESPFADEVVAASLIGMGSLIKHSKSADDLARAMITLVMENAGKLQKGQSSCLQVGLNVLLKACLEYGGIHLKLGRQIACELVGSKNWELWSEVAVIKDGILITESLNLIQSVLDDPSESESHYGILQSILKLLQAGTIQSPLSMRIFKGVGAGIVSILYLYGTNKLNTISSNQKSLICADAIKLCLFALQQGADNGGETFIVFLSVFFQTFIAVIRFNGLPNHPSPEISSDPNCGRACVQAILHIARTTPDAFKGCVAMLPEVDRTLLEFSVRAEMTGYVVAQQVPTKKKLNLAGFRKQ